MKDWGESVSELMIVKKTITRNCTQCSLDWVCLPFVHVVISNVLICIVFFLASFKLSFG